MDVNFPIHGNPFFRIKPIRKSMQFPAIWMSLGPSSRTNTLLISVSKKFGADSSLPTVVFYYLDGGYGCGNSSEEVLMLARPRERSSVYCPVLLTRSMNWIKSWIFHLFQREQLLPLCSRTSETRSMQPTRPAALFHSRHFNYCPI